MQPYVSMCAGPEEVTKRFRFQINGTSAPDFQFPAGAVLDVTRSSAGVFAILLPVGERYPGFVGVGGTVMGDDGVSLGLQVQSAVTDYDASTGILTVRTVDPYTDATPAAVDPTDNDWVYVEATFIRRSIFSVAGAV